MQQTRALLDAGVKVIDLAADFRIKDIAVWEKWYKMEHACPIWWPRRCMVCPKSTVSAIRARA